LQNAQALHIHISKLVNVINCVCLFAGNVLMCYAALAVVGVCVDEIWQLLLISSRNSIEAALEKEAQLTLEFSMIDIRHSIRTALDFIVFLQARDLFNEVAQRACCDEVATSRPWVECMTN
jgi:hypothetical protein